MKKRETGILLLSTLLLAACAGDAQGTNQEAASSASSESLAQEETTGSETIAGNEEETDAASVGTSNEEREKETEKTAVKATPEDYLTLDREAVLSLLPDVLLVDDASHLAGMHRAHLSVGESQALYNATDLLVDIHADGTYTSYQFARFSTRDGEPEPLQGNGMPGIYGYYLDSDLNVRRRETQDLSLINQDALVVSSGYLTQGGASAYGFLQVDEHLFDLKLDQYGAYTLNSLNGSVNEYSIQKMKAPVQLTAPLGYDQAGDVLSQEGSTFGSFHRMQEEELFSLLSMNEMKSANQLVTAIKADEIERKEQATREGRPYYHSIHEVFVDPTMTFLDAETYRGYTQDNREIVPEYVWQVTSDLFGSEVETIYGYMDHHVWTYDKTVNGWH